MLVSKVRIIWRATIPRVWICYAKMKERGDEWTTGMRERLKDGEDGGTGGQGDWGPQLLRS
jgi:hypothetical protein